MGRIYIGRRYDSLVLLFLCPGLLSPVEGLYYLNSFVFFVECGKELHQDIDYLYKVCIPSLGTEAAGKNNSLIWKV